MVTSAKGALLLATAALIILAPRIRADGEEGAISTSESSGSVQADELGTGTFSRLPFRVSASVRGGYDDNITTASVDRQESAFTNGSITLTYDFGSPRTQLSLQTGGGLTYYWDQSQSTFNNNQDYDVNGYLGLSLKHKASPRLTFDVSAYVTYQTEPDFTLALGLNRRSGNFFYTQDRFMTTYLWAPRFATATSYTFSTLRYDDMAIGLFEDRFEHTFGNEFKFLLWPTTTLVAEYRFQLVTYEHEGDVIGPVPGFFFGPFFIPTGPAPVLDRDSTSHFALLGIDHSFSPRFSASIRGGAEFRNYSDAEFIEKDRMSPYFEGTLNYALGKNTSLTWTNRYGIEEGDVQLSATRKTFRTGLRARHDITSRITANVGAYYQHDDYDSVDRPDVTSDSAAFTEEAFDIALSLRYAFTRYFGVEAGYNHTEVWSDVVFRDYSRNRYWAGLNVVF
jgi:hypothetical protein